MAASSKKPDHESFPVPVGAGLFRAGDFAKIPSGATPYAKNLFVRPGPRIEKRHGWLRDAAIDATMYPGVFAALSTDSSTSSTLVSGGGQLGKSGYRLFDGTYGVLSTLFSISDAANFLNKLYVTYSTTDSTIGAIDSFDGTSVTSNAIKSAMSAVTIAPFNHRLFAGYIREKPVNQVLTGAAYKFEDPAVWTLGGGPPTVAVTGTIRTLTIVGATDTLKTTAAAYTSGATEEYIQVLINFRANSTSGMPFTVTVEDAAGTVVYAKLDCFVANRTVQPDWQTFVFPSAVRLPATTAVYIKYVPGNASVAAVAGAVDVADSANNRGLVITKGRRTFATTPVGTGVSLFGTAYPYRFVWCEVDDPTYWRGTAYYDCKEVAGEITVIREGNGRLFVFKADAIWIFNPQDNADLPIVFAELKRNVGCVGVKAIEFFENTFFFGGTNEIYAWSGDGDPQPLAGDAMRETLFPVGGFGVRTLAVDQENRELWVVTNISQIYIYSLSLHTWTGPFTVTGTNDTTAVINDLIYIKASGESAREMWAAVEDANHTTGDIIKLRVGQETDNITGTEREVTAEYWLRPTVTSEPKRTFFMETIDLDHKITGDQTGSETTCRVSFDGGTTWDAENTVEVAPLASGDYQPMTLDLWQSSERMLIGIKHVGKAGPQFFNFSGASTMAQILGERTQSQNPTQLSSSL